MVEDKGVKGIKEAYHKGKLKSNDDMELHSYRWSLIDEQEKDHEEAAELFRKRKTIIDRRIQRGKWIVQTDQRAREIFEKK